MSHHLFLLSPSDSPIYSLSHQSTKSTTASTNPLAANLPSWSASAFAGTLTALSGASSVSHGHGAGGGGSAGRVGQQDRHVIQMIANASLDVIEDVMRKDGAMYLKAVDKFNEWTISAFVTPGNMKFILLHETKNDDGIRSFFMDVWELYVKVSRPRAISRYNRLINFDETLLNPFHTAYTPIRSSVFDGRVRASAKKYL
ncbi:transport protein particle complex subunit [Schizopora paradoxa]|uniref:Transport protein particle complex subunit n=1 Tax=Schizopora paradoxa TaxID=27342 RepID=A0A0H2QZJ1_9AGAM|nr:transport protein particle complex subunit [Schizopora paradoxa]